MLAGGSRLVGELLALFNEHLASFGKFFALQLQLLPLEKDRDEEASEGEGVEERCERAEGVAEQAAGCGVLEGTEPMSDGPPVGAEENEDDGYEEDGGELALHAR